MNVFELFATLGLDSSSYDAGLEQSEQKGNQFAATLSTALATGGKIAVGALAATTAAAIAGTAAFIDGINSVSEYGDTIDKMSQKMNMSAEAYQEWDFILEHAGASIESMKTSIKTLSTAAETGNEAFQKLGISQEEIASMSGEELFSATIEALQNVESETERTYLAGQLLGKGATELGPLLNMTAEETEAMKDQVHELNGILTDEQVKASAAFQDSLQNMQVALNGVKNNLLSEFLPSFTTVMDGLAAVFSGDDGGLALIDEGVEEFIEKLNEIAPKAMQVGTSILMSLISSISKNLPSLLSQGSIILGQIIQGIITALPSLLESAVLIIGQIGTALMENAPLILSTALSLVLMLATGISENAPAVIPAIVSVIKELVTTLTEPATMTLLTDAALQLILALAEGLVLALPDLISIIPIYYANMIQVIISEFPDLLNAVLVLLGDLGAAVFGIIGGLLGMNYDQITQALTNATNYIQNAFNNIINWFVSFGSTISSTVSSTWNGIVSFFSSGLSAASSAVSSALYFIQSTISSGLTNAYNIAAGVLNNISGAFVTIFEGAKSTVENAINYIKGLFNFEWSLPDIKLPHFSIKGTLDLLATPPTYPTVSVSWYDKAMDQPYLLNGATIFGAAGGRLLGGGESGSEMIIGTDKLMGMIKEAAGIGAAPITVNVYGAAGQDIRELAKEVSKEIQNIITDKEKAYA